MSTTLQKLQSLRESSPSRINKKISNGKHRTDQGSLMRYISTEPSFKKGTLSSSIRSYLSKRKNPATMREIVDEIRRNRQYKNYSSAAAPVWRELARLSNWSFVKPQAGRPARFMMSSTKSK